VCSPLLDNIIQHLWKIWIFFRTSKLIEFIIFQLFQFIFSNSNMWLSWNRKLELELEKKLPEFFVKWHMNVKTRLSGNYLFLFIQHFRIQVVASDYLIKLLIIDLLNFIERSNLFYFISINFYIDNCNNYLIILFSCKREKKNISVRI